jgi:hypothetical protein
MSDVGELSFSQTKQHGRRTRPFQSLFAKLRKVTIIFVMSACLSARQQFGSQWTDFNEIWYSSIFLKHVEKIIQVSLKCGKE